MRFTPFLLACLALLFTHSTPLSAQQRLACRVALNFPSLGLPGHRLSENFRNIGFSAGIDYGLSAAQATALRVEAGWYRTRAQGASLYLQGQFCYQPCVQKKLNPGLFIGAGYQLMSAPRVGLQRAANGEWVAMPNRKGSFYLPAGLSLGYRLRPSLQPFLQYQAQLIWGYNEGFPIFPAHLISVGQTFNF